MSINILLPQLFSISINELLEELKDLNSGLAFIIVAYDILYNASVCMISGRYVSVIAGTLAHELISLSEWLVDNKLSIHLESN